LNPVWIANAITGSRGREALRAGCAHSKSDGTLQRRCRAGAFVDYRVSAGWVSSFGAARVFACGTVALKPAPTPIGCLDC